MVVVVFVLIVGVLALMMDFRECMMTSTPELAHCGGGVEGGGGTLSFKDAGGRHAYILIFNVGLLQQ